MDVEADPQPDTTTDSFVEGFEEMDRLEKVWLKSRIFRLIHKR